MLGGLFGRQVASRRERLARLERRRTLPSLYSTAGLRVYFHLERVVGKNDERFDEARGAGGALSPTRFPPLRFLSCDIC